MPNLETGNSVQTDGNSGTNNASFESGLNSMLEGTKTGGEPVNSNGDNSKGNTEGNAGDTSKAPAWTSQLSEEVRGNAEIMKQLTKFGKISDLATSYAELEGKIGKSIVKPDKDASDADKQSFYEKLGKPKDVKGYSIQEEDAAQLRDIAFKNNLTDDQLKGVYEGLKAMGTTFVETQKQQRVMQVKNLEEAMQKEYGDKYGEKVAIMNRGIEAYGGKELGALLNDAGVLFTPQVAKLFIRLGEQAAEAGSSTKGTPGGNTQYKSILQGGTMTFKGL